MTLFADVPPQFSCIICGKAQMTEPWDKYPRADRPIPPICNRCSDTHGKAIGGIGDLNRDRRIIRQVSALADVITTTAYCIEKGHRYPYERT